MSEASTGLVKVKTGISGFDEITRGGLPRGRATLVAGNAGCGKSLFGMSFIVNGIRHYDEPGVFVTFEETPEDLRTNVRSLGFDLEKKESAKKLVIEHIVVTPGQIREAGEYDLTGLFIRIGSAIDSIGAKRVVLDTLESLFLGFSPRILRAELVRLFTFLKDKGVTTVVTGETGPGEGLSRHGIEEYVSDCVISLEHRIDGGISTRQVRVAKYRGTDHGTNEYPFIIDATGFVVLPITSVGLGHSAETERVSTGVAGLDEMISGGGVFRGSSILLSGTAGSGKTSFAASMVAAACARGERATLFSFEESPSQLIRNMESIGLALGPYLESGLLRILSARPTLYGLEAHLSRIYREIRAADPQMVVIDPMTSLLIAGKFDHARAVLLRLVDLLKSSGITAVFTSLGRGTQDVTITESEVSSLMDTWVSLRVSESNGERNRELYILKSRGMGHSNQIREFVLGKSGIRLLRPYVGAEGVLTGSARLVRELKEKAEADLRTHQIERLRQQLEQREKVLAAGIAKLEAEFRQERHELMVEIAHAEAQEQSLAADRQYLARRKVSTSFDEDDV